MKQAEDNHAVVLDPEVDHAGKSTHQISSELPVHFLVYHWVSRQVLGTSAEDTQEFLSQARRLFLVPEAAV
jgi:hypothetical protein